ncbi:MAG: DUF6436 domain-containing protein [Saccharospirillum sp.]
MKGALGSGLLLALVAAGAVYWFQATHLGWFGETVDDMRAWQSHWQGWVNEQAAVQHPAMVHLVPEGCLCRFFVQAHAADLSQSAQELGYRVYQTSSLLPSERAERLDRPVAFDSPGPLLMLTDHNGELRYLGPYSDGVRCNAETSLVDQWLPLSLGGQVIQLDASGCLCNW